MKIGIIIYKISCSNIYIVDVGWGQLRYFSSNENYEPGEVILYKEMSSQYDLEDEEAQKFYATREAWLKGAEDISRRAGRNEIMVICKFTDCDFHGNIQYDVHSTIFEKSKIVIARRDTFVYWERLGKGTRSYCSRMQNFDEVANALLFSLYAVRRYPYPNEKDWLNAFTYAKRKVAELDISKMIEELKVEVHNDSWTRRGSDNVLFSHSSLLYPYEYNYGYLGDKYLDAIFPKYAESLYSSKDDEIEYINPKYEKWEQIRMPDGSIK